MTTPSYDGVRPTGAIHGSPPSAMLFILMFHMMTCNRTRTRGQIRVRCFTTGLEKLRSKHIRFHQVDIFYVHVIIIDEFVAMINPFIELQMDPEIYVPCIYAFPFSAERYQLYVMPHRSELTTTLIADVNKKHPDRFFAIHALKLLTICRVNDKPPPLNPMSIEIVKQMNAICRV